MRSTTCEGHYIICFRLPPTRLSLGYDFDTKLIKKLTDLSIFTLVYMILSTLSLSIHGFIFRLIWKGHIPNAMKPPIKPWFSNTHLTWTTTYHRLSHHFILLPTWLSLGLALIPLIRVLMASSLFILVWNYPCCA